MAERRPASGQAREAIEQGTFAAAARFLREPYLALEDDMGRGLLLWLIGIPLPIILLIWLFGGLS
jgi:hypothetical protein